MKNENICNFYDFVKNYVIIKNGTNHRSFNDVELKKINMIDKGYELRLVRMRRGNIILYYGVKINQL